MDLTDHIMPPTVRKIFEHYKANRKGGHRPHLGGSQIGNECSRALWYQFRHVSAPQFDGRVLRLFETGDREEARIVANLRAVGVTVWDRDPETGRQIAYTAHGGHFALSLDGVGEGFEESSKPHTLEFKTMSEKNFRDCERKGVEKSKPVYWAQCQIGMHLSGLERCAFIAINKNSDEIYLERIKADPAEGLRLVAKAGQVIFTDQPPAKINDDPSFFLCRFCDYRGVCHEQKLPEVNCRTCANVTPEKDGTWSCRIRDELFPCDDHLFNPHVMPWPVGDAGDDWIEYTTEDGEVIRNHKNSQDLKNNEVPF